MEKKKIKIEPENDLERRIDALERIQGLVAFDKLEIEKRLIGHQKLNDKLKEIKTEEGINHGENQTLTDLKNKLRELNNQVLEKDRVVGAYHDRLQGFETKVTKMEKEIEELKQHKWMDNQIIKEMKSKLTESVLSEEKLRENNVEATRTVEELRRRILACEEEKKMFDEEMKRKESESIRCVEDLRHRILACEEEKKMADRVQEEIRHRESESIRCLEDLRRQNLEAESAAEVMARELLKADHSVKDLRRSVKELKQRSLAAGNLVPITEELGKLPKMNVNLKNKFVGDEGVGSPVSGGFGNGTKHRGAGSPHASKGLELRISAGEQSTKTWNPHKTTTPLSAAAIDIIEIIDCDDDEFASSPSANQPKKRNEIDCCHVHRRLRQKFR